jgi:probable phosphoglycerate mutase
MQLYLVRHGQSGGNAQTQPGPDPPLTELGRRQAALAAARLAGQKFVALHCSPLRRALQTADIIGRSLGLAPTIWVELCEKWQDGFRGPTRSEIQQAFPLAVLPHDMPEDQWWRPTGDTEEEAYLRAEQLRKRIWETYAGQDVSVLLITHGTFGSIMIGHLLECPPCGYTRFSQSNCGISRLDFFEGHWKLRFLNTTHHLPPEAIT